MKRALRSLLSFAPLMSLRRGLALPVLVAAVISAAGASRVSQTSDSWLLENRSLAVKVTPASGSISVILKRSGLEFSTVNPEGRTGSGFANVRRLNGSSAGLQFEVAAGNAAGPPCLIRLATAETGADLHVTVDLADHHAKPGDLFPLPPLALRSTNLAMAIADYSDGHFYPLASRPPRTWFDLWSIDMPFAGVCETTTGQGYAVIVETDDDAVIRLVKTATATGELWLPQPGFRPSQGEFRYSRTFFYHFSPKGGYVSLAKRFRDYARQRGFLVTFARKLKANPTISRIFGAPDVWGNASLNFAREARAAGVEKMIIHGRASAEEMKAINALGYVTSEYDNYTDIFQLEPGKEVDAHHGHLPDDSVLKGDGERMKAWLTWDKKQYMKRCPALWVPAARIVIPKVLSDRPFLGRFIDVTTAEDLYECYDTTHPLTRSAKRQCGVDLLSYTRSLGLVTGGEHGRYWAVPCLDYIEGMQSGGSFSWPAGWLMRPKSKDQEFDNPWGGKFGKWAGYEKWGIGHQTRVPLWELVFHDCVVSTWYWGDSSDFLLEAAPEITAKKDAFNVLYGTIPLLWANKEGSWTTARETFLRTYRNTCKLHELVAGKELLTHEFLTPDRAVQRTSFTGGTEAIVNFGREPYTVRLKGKTYQLPQNGFAVKGPGIEQSLAVVDGRPTTTIRTRNFRFSDGEIAK
ncbi:MAG TPA: glycoside hydrolase [Verrucomicrobiae bacterium]